MVHHGKEFDPPKSTKSTKNITPTESNNERYEATIQGIEVDFDRQDNEAEKKYLQWKEDQKMNINPTDRIISNLVFGSLKHPKNNPDLKEVTQIAIETKAKIAKEKEKELDSYKIFPHSHKNPSYDPQYPISSLKNSSTAPVTKEEFASAINEYNLSIEDVIKIYDDTLTEELSSNEDPASELDELIATAYDDAYEEALETFQQRPIADLLQDRYGFKSKNTLKMINALIPILVAYDKKESIYKQKVEKNTKNKALNETLTRISQLLKLLASNSQSISKENLNIFWTNIIIHTVMGLMISENVWHPANNPNPLETTNGEYSTNGRKS